MKKILHAILSLALAAVVLATIPASTAEASYLGTYFDFSEQTISVARGESKTITMYTEYAYSFKIEGAYSKQTTAYVVGRQYGRDQIRITVGADETAGRVRVMVYINDSNHRDQSARDFIYVNVYNNTASASTSSTATNANTTAAANTSQTVTVPDNTDYFAFQQSVAAAAAAAPAKANLVISTGTWNSLYTTALDALAARTDLTVTVNWVQDGAVRTFTLPAGTITTSLRDSNGFLGFDALQTTFGQ